MTEPTMPEPAERLSDWGTKKRIAIASLLGALLILAALSLINGDLSVLHQKLWDAYFAVHVGVVDLLTDTLPRVSRVALMISGSIR